MQTHVVIGLGSNLGDRLANLRAACEAIERLPAVSRSRRSPVYETAPVGPPQPHYLNAALRVECTCTPVALLDALLAIERGMGRERRERWGPRTIDLDVLWWEGVAIDDGPVILPHPRLRERAFALVPLCDVAPDATDPEGARFADVPLAVGMTPFAAL